jgi:hypothetical protein
VIGQDRSARVPRPDADLVVERLRALVPHLHEPFEAELCLTGEVRIGRPLSQLLGERLDAVEHERHHVAGCLDELEVVAGVPPSAGGIHGCAEGCQVAFEIPVGID